MEEMNRSGDSLDGSIEVQECMSACRGCGTYLGGETGICRQCIQMRGHMRMLQVLVMRSDGMTYRQIADHLKVTKERARQLHNKACRLVYRMKINGRIYYGERGRPRMKNV